VVGARGGFGRLAVSPEVGRHDGEVLRQIWGDLVPHGVRLRITVEQKKGRPIATLNAEDVHVVDRYRERAVLLEHELQYGFGRDAL
jgi:hypothetical protein